MHSARLFALTLSVLILSAPRRRSRRCRSQGR